MKRALTANDILNAQIEYWDFEGAFFKSIGKPEGVGSWIIGGVSASGKSSFILLLCKYLLNFSRVYYNSIEMKPKSRVMQKILLRTGMQDTIGFMVEQESIPDMIIRLKKHKSPNVVVIDSIQHSFIKRRQYKQLKETFPNKLFIWITHFDSRNRPFGAMANFIWYDADVKMTTEGFRMFADSRYLDGGKGEPFTVWKVGAEDYWGDVDNGN